MSACWTPLIGRFGNQLFQFCYARAYAEQNSLELHTPRWIGEKIFQIEPTPEKQPDDLILGGYCQNQASLIYTRKQAKEWFKFKPEIEEKLLPFKTVHIPVMAHLRRGDFEGYGFPLVSKQSYIKGVTKHGLENCGQVWIAFVSEENPLKSSGFDFAPFLPDFYHLLTAPVTFRANSSFSYWPAVLGNGRVFSPIINGLEGGKEHDCEFVEGNWPRLSEMEDCTDLHLLES